MLVALILVAAAAVAGHRPGGRHPGPVSPLAAAPTAEAALPLAATGKRCSLAANGRLQLGIEIVNQSPADVLLRRARAVLLLGGLRATTATWARCGRVPPPAAGGDHLLAAGTTAWLSITFDVLVPCPAPLPVRFTVDYTGGTRHDAVIDLPGFDDLGDVPYSRLPCPTNAPSRGLQVLDAH
jgi:hypothetical protein